MSINLLRICPVTVVERRAGEIGQIDLNLVGFDLF